MDVLRERLAAYAHDEAWAHWMKYLFSRCEIRDDGAVVIPADLAERWQRQARTAFATLPGPERESDRRQADLILAIVGEHVKRMVTNEFGAEIAALRAQLDSETGTLLHVVEERDAIAAELRHTKQERLDAMDRYKGDLSTAEGTIAALRAALAAATAWQPVADGLPDLADDMFSDDVLVLCGGRCYQAYLRFYDDSSDGGWGYEWQSEDDGVYLADTTHWRPLPQPPSEVEA